MGFPLISSSSKCHSFLLVVLGQKPGGSTLIEGVGWGSYVLRDLCIFTRGITGYVGSHCGVLHGETREEPSLVQSGERDAGSAVFVGA